MGEQRWFCRDEAEWHALAERLKQVPCPHCKTVGMLIRHGFLRGYDAGAGQRQPGQRQTIRARRIFCSNRHRRRGCGCTFSVWLADKIRRLSVTTHAVWQFLQRAVADTLAAASRVVTDCRRSDRTWQRIWKRFDLGQSRLRTALSACRAPPEPSAAPWPRPTRQPARQPGRLPATQILAHLRAAFADAECPIAAFQHSTRTFFV